MTNTNKKGGDSATRLRFLCFNANSLGTNPKRAKVLKYMSKINADFIIVTDSRICPTIEHIVKQEWEGSSIFNSFSSQSRGIAIFMKKGNIANILDTFKDNQGNILSILFEYEGKKILLEGIYGPNNDSPNFYENEVFEQIEAWEPSFSIFVGDWNVALDQSKDTKNYTQENNQQSRRAILDKMEQLNLVDIYRELYPDSKIYTWQKFNQNKFARLDYFLISSSLAPFVQNTSIIPSFCSDHSPIILDIDFTKFKRGRGFWKFNNSLVSEPGFVELIKMTIKKTCCQYAIVNDDPNFYINANQNELQVFLNEQTPESLQNLKYKANPQLFLDTLLMEIRKATISYSINKKKKQEAKQQLLMHEIEVLDFQIQNYNQSFNELNDKIYLKNRN